MGFPDVVASKFGSPIPGVSMPPGIAWLVIGKVSFFGLNLVLLDHLGVSENNGTPKSSILIGFSIINHPFWGTPIFGNTHLEEESMMFVTNFFFAFFLGGDKGFHQRKKSNPRIYGATGPWFFRRCRLSFKPPSPNGKPPTQIPWE